MTTSNRDAAWIADKRKSSITLLRQNMKIFMLHLVVFFSGLAGLGYQMSWTRMLSVSLGHEFVAVLAVISAFFVGLSLGAFSLNKIIRRTNRPVFWYFLLEVLIGFWALLLVFILPQLNSGLPRLIGTTPQIIWHWCVAFTSTLLILLPSTLAMGATLPAVERMAASLFKRQNSIAGIYSLNTLGAVLGTLVSTYWLLPVFGLNTTLVSFAAINLLIGCFSYFYFKSSTAKGALQNRSDPSQSSPRLLIVLFFTGLLGLGFEVVVVRVLAQVLEGTVFTYAAILAIYLLATAAGAACYQRCIHLRAWRFDARDGHLIMAVSLSCIIGSYLLWFSEASYTWVFSHWGSGLVAALFAEMTTATLVLFLPAFIMGGLFSHLVQKTKAKGGLGLAFGFNTLGAAFAPLMFGVVLLPALGAKLTLAVICASYLLLLVLAAKSQVDWRALLPLGLLSAFVLMPFPMQFVDKADDSRLLHYTEGVVATVAIVEEADQSRHLRVNNHFTMGGTASRFSDHRQSHLPFLLQGGSAESALYLGLGTGVTFQAAQYYKNLKATGVELIPELVELMPWFNVDVKGPHWINKPKIITADARRFVVADKNLYDVIISEVFHPARDGAGSLYTREHFLAVKSRLSDNGVFCQWLPLFQLELDVLKLIVRTYLEVFTNAQMHMAHYSLGQPLLCLLGGAGLDKFHADWLVNKVHYRPLQRELVLNRLNSDYVLFGGYLGGADSLRRFAGDGPLNLDDKPLVTYTAPKFVYKPSSLPAERLLAIIQQTAAHREGLLVDADVESDGEFNSKLRAYWQARDIYLSAGVGFSSRSDLLEMYQKSAKKLKEAVAISPEFTAAYDALLTMAKVLYRSDPSLSKQILSELQLLNPSLDSARKLRARLFP
ncbi:MAG: fused MFS/spermidine synthase [Cellvibrionaceae bacterium]|nr:fused MFS/spermidine synthase [Cellvibrionaceae bacterium]